MKLHFPIASGDEVYPLAGREDVLRREQLELELNERLLRSTEKVSIPDEIDPAIARQECRRPVQGSHLQ